jgi:hypothetical protein
VLVDLGRLLLPLLAEEVRFFGAGDAILAFFRARPEDEALFLLGPFLVEAIVEYM